MSKPAPQVPSLARAVPIFVLSGLSLLGCASGGSVIPDNTAKVEQDDGRANPEDVFLRDPWELWKTPNGRGRYHRGTFMLLADHVDSFKLGDIAIYQKDGSDVRFDYHSVDFGAGSQSLETINIFVSRAASDADAEWSAAVDRLRHQFPGAEGTEPFPIPVHYPADTRQAAFLAKEADRFVQVSLFRRAGWTVRYEINCPAEDVTVARQKTLGFLREIRYRD
jgi:hypothetical protein